MSKFIGDQLNDVLLSRLGIDRALESADRAIVRISVDADTGGGREPTAEKGMEWPNATSTGASGVPWSR